MLREGDEAPNFELPSHNGRLVSLESLCNKQSVVLCFYPKNRLFGCPSKKVYQMAQSMISAYPQIRAAGSEVLAISSDTVADQERFVREWSIPYMHLSDTSKHTCRTYAGLNLARLARRSTFVIDERCRISRIFRDITVPSHGDEVLEVVRQLN